MKKTVLFGLVAVSSGLLSCSKSDLAPGLPRDKGCSELKFVPVSGHDLSSADLQTANALFASNNIDSRNLRFTRYTRETVQTYFPPYASFDLQVVRVEEYVNGLPNFTGESNFLFKNGVFSFHAGEPSKGTTLSPSSTLSAEQLRGLFVASISKFDADRNNVDSKCVESQFGYYNLNAGTGTTTGNLAKVWRVSVKNQVYPFAYYQDKDGSLIYYDNGIRTSR